MFRRNVKFLSQQPAASGYVLLAVASFMAGDVITAVLSRKRNRTETEEKQEERRS